MLINTMELEENPHHHPHPQKRKTKLKNLIKKEKTQTF